MERLVAEHFLARSGSPVELLSKVVSRTETHIINQASHLVFGNIRPK